MDTPQIARLCLLYGMPPRCVKVRNNDIYVGDNEPYVDSKRNTLRILPTNYRCVKTQQLRTCHMKRNMMTITTNP